MLSGKGNREPGLEQWHRGMGTRELGRDIGEHEQQNRGEVGCEREEEKTRYMAEREGHIPKVPGVAQGVG
jgi:hypothetical protein